ncbi:MAG: DUF72 domain-containing protein [Candidatus Pacearchaeota archaeon]
MKFWIGTSGYVYWHWRKLFYPEELPSYKWFDYYVKHFNTVEINMSFYRWPKESTVKGWLNKAKKIEQESGKRFIYTLKANQLITHIKKLVNVERLVRDFYKLADLLSHYLGCILFQLPPSLHFDKQRLKQFLACLDKSYKNVIEFRHPSWWNESTYELMQDKAIFSIVSAPRLPEDFVKTADIIYIRFHGKKQWYGSNYSDAELKEWAKKIKKAKAKEVYCYFNNDFNAYAVHNALTLKKLLEK